MPRKARQQSSLCIHHVILRGINKQIIFEDRYDYLQFISVLKYYKEKCNFRLYAYCLMDNHIHLLIQHSGDDLEIIMKKIEIKFVRWYNNKYNRIGNLFQERYKSEAIDNEAYFLTVFRYIHQNPLKAGIESIPGIYPWSSYHCYANLDDSFVDIDTIINLFPDYSNCIRYLNTVADDKCLDYLSYRLKDPEALQLIQKLTSCKSPSDFQHLDISTRNKYLYQLVQNNISIRQLSRLTGISRTSISNAIKS